MEIYQLIAPAFASIYIYRLVLELKRRRKFLITNIIWLVFWTVIAIIGFFPHEVSIKIANWFGFASNINAIIFIALAFLTLLVFYLSSKLDTTERKLTELVRQLALDESRIKQLEEMRRAEQKKRDLQKAKK